MSTVIDEFIEEARAVDLETVAALCGVAVRGRTDEKKGPCPRCGGKDRFSINYHKGLWNCGHLGGAGGDGLALVAHCLDFDLRRRADLLEACSTVLCRPVPAGGERESEEDRRAREERLAALRAKAEAEAAEKAAEGEAWREKAVRKARGLYFKAGDGRGTEVAEYLRLRTGFIVPDAAFTSLRFSPRHGYWHGRDERGFAVEMHCGPAMLAPFVDPAGQVTGCHETWIDLGSAPKFRPRLVADGESLPTKKMQGAVKGALIPILGELSAGRWVGGEGIENVVAVAGAEGWRADTFYFAAGSLGNLAGPADAASGFPHPTLRKPGSDGRLRPVRVAGCVPRSGSEGDAVFVPGHVEELVLLADNDSEPLMTACAMERASARHARPGRHVEIEWPPEHYGDFAEAMLAGLNG